MDIRDTTIDAIILKSRDYREPVSYTHLDVYKRQAWDRGAERLLPAILPRSICRLDKPPARCV